MDAPPATRGGRGGSTAKRNARLPLCARLARIAYTPLLSAATILTRLTRYYRRNTRGHSGRTRDQTCCVALPLHGAVEDISVPTT